MKKLTILLFSIILFLGCSKKEKDSSTNTVITITGLSDITLKNEETKKMNIEVNNTSDGNEIISLTSEGLPKGLSIDFTPNSGIKKFNSSVSITTDTAAVSGIYPIKIIATTASGVKKEFEIKVTLDITKYNFIINGLANLTLSGFTSKSYSIEVKQTGSIQENVNLTAEGLPPGVIVSFSPNSGITTFSSTVSFENISNTKSGIYPITIVAKNSSGVKKSYTINLTLDIPCVLLLVGNYSLIESINGVDKPSINTTIDKAGPGYIYIYDYQNYHSMTFDCNLKTVNLFTQPYNFSSGAGTISGTGTFTDSTITVVGTFEAFTGAGVKTFKRFYKKI